MLHFADGTTIGRPAFDCRGCVTIAFSKSNKSISLTYEHTPVHKTVAQLLDLLAPTLPPPPAIKPPAVRKPARTPKTKGPAADPNPQDEGGEGGGGGGGSNRKKRKSTTQDGYTSHLKQPKRRKEGTETSQGHAQVQAQAQAQPHIPGAAIQPPEMPGALPVGESPPRPLYNTQTDPAAEDISGRETSTSYPEALVEASDGPTESQRPTAASPAAHAHAQSILALPPEEVERRRDMAVQLLRDNNIDLQTLSSEQFNIFSNQSPELQKESLLMLAKYGAERLRIVHPNKQAPASNSANVAGPNHEIESSSSNASQSNAAGAISPTGSQSPVTRKQTKTSDIMTQDGTGMPSETKTAATRQRNPRNSCEQCLTTKIKCGRERPSCSQCLESEIPCFYPPPRRRKAKSELVAETEESHEEGLRGLQSCSAQDESITIPETELASPPVSHQTSSAEANAAVYQHASVYSFSHSLRPNSLHQTWPSSSTSGQSGTHVRASSTLASTTHQGTRDAPTLPYPEPPSGIAVSATSINSPSDPQPGLHPNLPAQGSATNFAAAAGADADIRSSLQTTNYGAVSPVEQATLLSQSVPRNPSPTRTYKSRQAPEIRQHASGLSHLASDRNASFSPSARVSPSPAPTSISRGTLRQGAKSRTRTPIQAPSAARQTQVQAKRPVNDHAHSSSVSTNTAPASNYNHYPKQPTNEELQSNNRTPYEPSSQQYGASTTETYPNYGTYNTPPQDTSTSMSLPSTATQETSYAATTAPRASQWNTSSTTRSHNPLPHDINPSIPATSSYLNNAQQSRSLNLSSRATNQNSSSTGESYNQQSQSQQPSYSSYPLRQQQNLSSQDNWYGFGPSETSSSGYDMSTRGSGAGAYSRSVSHGSGDYNQQHQPVSHSGHAYTNIDTGDQAIYNLLRGSPGT